MQYITNVEAILDVIISCVKRTCRHVYSYIKCAPISSYPYEILERKIVLYDRKDNVGISNNITGDISGEYI